MSSVHTGPGLIFGDVATPSYGATFTNSSLDQKYAIFGTSLAKTFNRHPENWLDFERTHVDGTEANGQQDQLFATQAITSSSSYRCRLLSSSDHRWPHAQANQNKLRNNYNGLWAQTIGG